MYPLLLTALSGVDSDLTALVPRLFDHSHRFAPDQRLREFSISLGFVPTETDLLSLCAASEELEQRLTTLSPVIEPLLRKFGRSSTADKFPTLPPGLGEFGEILWYISENHAALFPQLLRTKDPETLSEILQKILVLSLRSPLNVEDLCDEIWRLQFVEKGVWREICESGNLMSLTVSELFIVSIWPDADTGTRNFVNSFYHHYLSEKPATTASAVAAVPVWVDPLGRSLCLDLGVEFYCQLVLTRHLSQRRPDLTSSFARLEAALPIASSLISPDYYSALRQVMIGWDLESTQPTWKIKILKIFQIARNLWNNGDKTNWPFLDRILAVADSPEKIAQELNLVLNGKANRFTISVQIFCRNHPELDRCDSLYPAFMRAEASAVDEDFLLEFLGLDGRPGIERFLAHRKRRPAASNVVAECCVCQSEFDADLRPIEVCLPRGSAPAHVLCETCICGIHASTGSLNCPICRARIPL